MRTWAKLMVTAIFIAATALNAAASPQYNYMSADELETRLKAGTNVHVVDIQVEPEYAGHHIRGAYPTYSYPVKSDEDKAKLDSAIPVIKDTNYPVVIVCPRGGGGAERACDHLKGKGIDGTRLFILEKGQAGWKSAELTVKGK